MSRLMRLTVEGHAFPGVGGRPVCTLVALFFIGCSDSTGPQTGSLSVSLSMTGAAPDANGCVVAVDGGPGQLLQAEESFTIEDLSKGTHDVTISDVADNCIVQGEASREVAVSANETTSVDFILNCPVPGSIEVLTRTTGSLVDADGYAVVLGGETTLAIGLRDAETFVEVAVGHHELELTGLADNCAAAGPNPVSVTVTEAAGTRITFAIACPPFYDHIAFVSGRDGDSDIWVMEPDGGNPVNLTPDAAWLDTYPAWSPDGTRIAFTRRPRATIDEVSDVYVLNTASMNVTRLTFDAGVELSAWSQDGTKIAYSSFTGPSQGDRSGDIYLVNTDGSNPVNLTPGPQQGFDPAWSPDGTKIAFTRGREGENISDVWVMEVDGSNPVRLTDHQPGEFAWEPAWSPDGARIAFAGPGHSDGPRIWVMDADGSNLVNLTPYDAYYHAWRPLGHLTAPGLHSEHSRASLNHPKEATRFMSSMPMARTRST